MVPSKEGPNHISQDLLSCVYMCLTKKKRIVGLLGRALSMLLFVQPISPPGPCSLDAALCAANLPSSSSRAPEQSISPP